MNKFWQQYYVVIRELLSKILSHLIYLYGGIYMIYVTHFFDDDITLYDLLRNNLPVNNVRQSIVTSYKL